jgi:histidinol-phosphate aminotransferase
MSALRPSVLSVRPYLLRAETAPVRLNRNESPFDFPEEWKREVLERAMERAWSRYPEFAPAELIGAIARRWEVPVESVRVGNGSNELLQALVQVTLEPGRTMLTVEPTFVLYAQQAELVGAGVLTEEFTEGWAFDVRRLARRLRRERPAAAFLCSPNNPTGTCLEEAGLREILAASPDTLVVVDEAYGEFAGWSAVPWVRDHRNLAVLKTFSKAAGLAGLRIGYLVAPPLVAAVVARAKLPYSVNLLAALAAERALEGRDLLEERIKEIVQERERVREALAAIPGVRVTPSRANFLLFEVDDAQRVFQSLVESGVLVRDVSGGHPRLARSLRVTIGTPRENDLFLRGIGAAMEGAR